MPGAVRAPGVPWCCEGMPVGAVGLDMVIAFPRVALHPAVMKSSGPESAEFGNGGEPQMLHRMTGTPAARRLDANLPARDMNHPGCQHCRFNGHDQ